MTRFAWLQSRTQTLAWAGLLAVLALAATVTGIHLAHVYTGITASCRALGDCQDALAQFLARDHWLQSFFNAALQVAPALLGVFWGAPLIAREYETGTVRLAWTQGVSRARWLVTKLALGGGISLVSAGLLTLTVTWWYRSFDHVSANQYSSFDFRDITPIGYALFAFAVGALAGAVIRRTVAAMAVTLAAFVLVRNAIDAWVRPHLFPPVHLLTSLAGTHGTGVAASGGPANAAALDLVTNGATLPNAWVFSAQIVTKSGQPTTLGQRLAFLQRYCPRLIQQAQAPPPVGPNHPVKAPNGPFESCFRIASHHFSVLTSYQPANRYWALQGAETGIYVLIALLAAAGCYWWITRRSA